jgi:hypothetical protein
VTIDAPAQRRGVLDQPKDGMSEGQVSGHAQNDLYRNGYTQSLLELDFCHIGGTVRVRHQSTDHTV